MKKALFLIILFFHNGFVATAQLEKGSLMVGGTGFFFGGFNNPIKNFGFSLQPRVGFFVANKFVIGSEIGFSYQSLRQNNSLLFSGYGIGISPFIRYYFLKMASKVNIFSETGHNFSQNWVRQNGANETAYRLDVNFSAGVAYFIRPQIALEFRLQTNANLLSPSSAIYAGPRFGGMFGFQIHLNKPSQNTVE